MSIRADVVKEGAKVIVELSCGYCIKPEINVTNLKGFHAIVNISCVSHGNFRQPHHYWAVLKNIYFRPWWFIDCSYMYAYQLCSPGHISVDSTGSVLQQCVQSGLKVGRLFTLLNTHVEELVEVFQ